MPCVFHTNLISVINYILFFVSPFVHKEMKDNIRIDRYFGTLTKIDMSACVRLDASWKIAELNMEERFPWKSRYHI